MQNSPNRPRRFEYAVAERLSILVLGVYFIAFIALVHFRQHTVDWHGYSTVFYGCLVIFAVGSLCRFIGLPNIGATGITLGIIFGMLFVTAPLTHAILPLWRAPIDPALASLDRALGFVWPQALELASHFPNFVATTHFAYNSVAPQFFGLIVVLGVSGRTRDLQLFLAAITLTSIVTIGFWCLFPAFGPTTLYSLDFEATYGFKPVINMEYGQKMLRMANEGPTIIAPKDLLGLIAVPSYHIVMALLAIYASRNLIIFRVPLFALNLLVLPGTIIHGGHHLIDVIAGVIVTFLGIVAAARLIDGPKRQASLIPSPV